MFKGENKKEIPIYKRGKAQEVSSSKKGETRISPPL
jgi:hypothetical protein